MTRKWSVLAFLCGIFVVYTVDRALIGLLAIPIQREFALTDVQLGVLSSAIFWTYAAVAPFSGLAGDRFNRVRLIGFAVICWSAMAICAGFAGGFATLLLFASFALVIPQTFYSPTASALIASVHVETRTVAMSCHQAAFYTGWFVSGASVAALLSFFGTWRAAFFAFGGLGLILGIAFLVVFGREDRTGGTAGTAGAKPTFAVSLRAYFGCRSALLASVAYVTCVFVSCGYCAWGPKFVAEKFGISPAKAGTGVMFWHYAASFAAILLAGFLTDAMVRRHPRFRIVLSSSALALAIPALVLFAFGPTLPLTLTGAAFLGAMLGVLGANQFTNLFDVIPSACRAGAIGFLNVAAGLVGSLSPILLGGLSQSRGIRGLELGFAVMGAALVLPIAAFAVSFFFTFNRERLTEQ